MSSHERSIEVNDISGSLGRGRRVRVTVARLCGKEGRRI
jgi:hypothetical protein